MSIQDIKPIVPEGEELADDSFTLQTFNAGAGCADQFMYLTADGGLAEDGEGWYYDYDWSVKADYQFKPGEGFMFQSAFADDSGAGYTMAGQVVKGETFIPVNENYTLIGNIRPAKVSIQDIKPVVPEGEELADDSFTLQTFNAGAGCADQFMYLTADGGLAEDGEGWYYDYDWSVKADYDFEAGEGFMFQSAFKDIDQYETGKSAGVKFPAVIE